MPLRVEQRSARRRIRVRAHAGQIDRDRARIMRFEMLARVSHVIAGDDVEVIAGNAGAMTGVTKQNRAHSSIGPHDFQYWHVLVHWAVRVLAEIDLVAIVNPAVHRESRATYPMFQSRRFQIRQGRADHFGQLRFQERAVLVDLFLVRRRKVIH